MTATLASLERLVSKHPAQSESVKPSPVITAEALLSGFTATALGLNNKPRPTVKRFSPSSTVQIPDQFQHYILERVTSFNFCLQIRGLTAACVPTSLQTFQFQLGMRRLVQRRCKRVGFLCTCDFVPVRHQLCRSFPI